MALTLEEAKKILPKYVKEESLIKHSISVSAAMGQMAEHFGQDKDYWMAVGYLHDVDYELYPDNHLEHTYEILHSEGVDDETIHAIITHGYSLLNDEKPSNDLEKSLFTVDELTGIIQAASLMRPTGITDIEVKSVNKKFKDLKFAAKCDREVIKKGFEMLGMEQAEVIGICIEGMKPFCEDLGLGVK